MRVKTKSTRFEEDIFWVRRFRSIQRAALTMSLKAYTLARISVFEPKTRARLKLASDLLAEVSTLTCLDLEPDDPAVEVILHKHGKTRRRR